MGADISFYDLQSYELFLSVFVHSYCILTRLKVSIRKSTASTVLRGLRLEVQRYFVVVCSDRKQILTCFFVIENCFGL